MNKYDIIKEVNGILHKNVISRIEKISDGKYFCEIDGDRIILKDKKGVICSMTLHEARRFYINLYIKQVEEKQKQESNQKRRQEINDLKREEEMRNFYSKYFDELKNDQGDL